MLKVQEKLSQARGHHQGQNSATAEARGEVDKNPTDPENELELLRNRDLFRPSLEAQRLGAHRAAIRLCLDQRFEEGFVEGKEK